MAQPSPLPADPQAGAQAAAAAQAGTQRTPPPVSSAPPASPTKSLWKRLLNRDTSADPEPFVHSTSPDQLPSPPPEHPVAPQATQASLPGTPPVRDSGDLEPYNDAQQPTRGSTGDTAPNASGGVATLPAGNSRRAHREVVPSLPRAQTFARQQSELRENLLLIMPSHDERRAASGDRRLTRSVSSPTGSHVLSNPRTSEPNVSHQPATSERAPAARSGVTTPGVVPPVPSAPSLGMPGKELAVDNTAPATIRDHAQDNLAAASLPASPGADQPDKGLDEGLDCHSLPGDATRESFHVDTSSMTSSQYEQRLRYELERVWILNLSMHFRDKSRREKFFVTYRQRLDLIRRVTVSLDYRNAPEGSLEMDLFNTKLQREKNEMIYEAIRESLADIQFYDTVTNLKLQTTDGQLHVHVAEDVTEIIDYPPNQFIQHLGCRKIREHDVEFDSHVSGFVYKVRVKGRTLIKKEIPGPDSVDEFLYEVNALDFLRASRNVIELYGVVLGDDDRVRGLLISYAEQGALIDILYDSNHGIPWHTRMKWARQIVLGLSEIHEAGFVQGDFTLSNIVINDNGNAKIIDINRRGCPVGWEPPEATPLIQSDQRISLYIGVKSDLYQLGMVLWALATQDDDPEAHGRPLHLGSDVDVPRWYRTVVETCLAEDPRVRAQARQLLTCFPDLNHETGRLDDSDCDDWIEGPHNRGAYARSAPSVSADDASTSPRRRALVESAPSSDCYVEDDADFAGGENGLSSETYTALAPRIKSVSPTNDWTHMSFGHTYVDPSNGISNEPYYFPTRRGRSPPSTSRRGSTHGYTTQRAASWTRTSSLEHRGRVGSSEDRAGGLPDPSRPIQDSLVSQSAEAGIREVADARVPTAEDDGTAAEAATAAKASPAPCTDEATPVLDEGESAGYTVDKRIGTNNALTFHTARDDDDQEDKAAAAEVSSRTLGTEAPTHNRPRSPVHADEPDYAVENGPAVDKILPAGMEIAPETAEENNTTLLDQVKSFGAVTEDSYPRLLELHADFGEGRPGDPNRRAHEELSALAAT